jgi:small GTP-binding protein
VIFKILRQAFIIKKDELIYQRTFGNAITISEVEELQYKIRQDALKKLGKAIGFYDYFKYRVAYDVEIELDLIFILVTGLMDDFFRLTQTQLINFKNEFLEQFKADLDKKKFDSSKIENFDSMLDDMHKNLKPKIAVVGFSGVGKTTIKNLIKQDKIPIRHIPTISGDIATIKISKLEFKLFDFAGQDQFSYLWKGFIKGSNAVLIVTDSTPENVERSRFFLKLINQEAPYARSAIIGNKQDLNGAMKIEDIENILGLKAYGMIANRSENRDKMIGIIADVLEMDIDESPLLKDTVRKIKSQFPLESNVKDKIIYEDSAELKPVISIITPKKEKNESLINEIKHEREPKYIKSVNLPLDLCNELVKEIKGVKIDNHLDTHYKMISSTIKTLNKNQQYNYADFKRSYFDYLANKFRVKNVVLKQFLESQFSLLQKSIEKDDFITTKLKDDLNTIINALICSYLTTVNPKDYPDFNSLLKKFRFDLYNENSINETHAYYLRILNKFKK